jgi:hypothetical protein
MALALISSVALLAPAAGAVIVHHYKSPAVRGSHDVTNWGATFEAANQLNATLPADYPSQFGGISMSDNNSVITVYVTSTTPDLQSTVSSIAPVGSVQYETVSNTWQSLLAVHTALQSDASSLKAQGIQLVGFGTDSTKNREVLQVVDPTTAQIAQLQSQYGTRLIKIQALTQNDTTPL